MELAVDRGDVSAGRRTSPIAEFELELKRGRPADLFRLAKNCQRRIGGELDLRSKSERGYRLADGDDRMAARGEPIQLRSKMAVREAFDVIAYSTLRHFSSNADGVRSLDSEAVHQMRVGLRRLRAATAHERHKLRIKIKKLRYAAGFFESLYADAERKELARFSGHLKKLQDALGALNDFIAHREMATDAALNAPPENRRARAFASGVMIGQEHEAAKKLMNRARREFELLKPLRAKSD